MYRPRFWWRSVIGYQISGLSLQGSQSQSVLVILSLLTLEVELVVVEALVVPLPPLLAEPPLLPGLLVAAALLGLGQPPPLLLLLLALVLRLPREVAVTALLLAACPLLF